LVSQQIGISASSAGGDSLEPVCDTARRLKESLGESVVRSLHLMGLTAPDLVRAGMKSLRSSDLSLLREGSYHKFGLNRLLRLAEFTGCEVRIEVDLPHSAGARGLASHAAAEAFLALRAAGEASRDAAAAIGSRRHPGAHATASVISAACLRAAETLRAAGRTAERAASDLADVLDALTAPLAAALPSLNREEWRAASATIRDTAEAAEALRSLARRTSGERP